VEAKESLEWMDEFLRFAVALNAPAFSLDELIERAVAEHRHRRRRL
jgi:hypothetical protein